MVKRLGSECRCMEGEKEMDIREGGMWFREGCMWLGREGFNG